MKFSFSFCTVEPEKTVKAIGMINTGTVADPNVFNDQWQRKVQTAFGINMIDHTVIIPIDDLPVKKRIWYYK